MLGCFSFILLRVLPSRCSIFLLKKKSLFVAVLLSFMMPFELIVIPLYALMRGLNWTDTYAALILPEVAGGLIIFLFRQFFAGIPGDSTRRRASTGRRGARFICA